jgi:hypothetical protein
MRGFVSSLLVVGFITASVDGADRLDQLFASWQAKQREVKSLVVEFTLEIKDRAFETVEQRNGTIRLLHTPKGKVFASYELAEPPAKGEKPKWFRALLNDGKIYVLQQDKKRALRLEATDGDLLRFLDAWFNPFVLLLDRKRAEASYQLKVVKQDKWYTYLTVKPKQTKADGFTQARAALMNQASERIPKDMPGQLWSITDIAEWTWKINSWRLNAPNAPKPEEFTRPEERPGWEVFDLSSVGGKK